MPSAWGQANEWLDLVATLVDDTPLKVRALGCAVSDPQH